MDCSDLPEKYNEEFSENRAMNLLSEEERQQFLTEEAENKKRKFESGSVASVRPLIPELSKAKYVQHKPSEVNATQSLTDTMTASQEAYKVAGKLSLELTKEESTHSVGPLIVQEETLLGSSILKLPPDSYGSRLRAKKTPIKDNKSNESKKSVTDQKDTSNKSSKSEKESPGKDKESHLREVIPKDSSSKEYHFEQRYTQSK